MLFTVLVLNNFVKSHERDAICNTHQVKMGKTGGDVGFGELFGRVLLLQSPNQGDLDPAPLFFSKECAFLDLYIT